MDRKRFVFFIVGIVLGSVLVYFMLIKGKKFPSWLPQDRVKEQIVGTRLILNPKSTCILSCNNIDPKEVGIAISNGDVLFSKSDTRKKPYPVYQIEGKTTTGVEMVVFTETNSKTQVTNILNIEVKQKSQLQKCSCDSL
ncbi:MAG: hypothetical protein M0D57_12615 [Sphingobacteriales bacterium JAD_PAG50586_3]|nr:MAG: hypothetical protein M0D57_12615 [Sphingobacteriales bacterium JAD_PAG50586_3]